MDVKKQINEPLVTILTPCYNVAAYLPQCLESIINQTYKNLQIVLIDDGSKDKTWGILQNYALKDQRIEIYQQQNQGVASTRNNLLNKVKGDYVLFVDSDDWIESNMVEYMLTQILDYNADLVTCGKVINDNIVSVDFSVTDYSKTDAIERFLYHKEFRGELWNKLFKTSILSDILFERSISYGEDALFCWYALQRCKRVLYTNRQLYHYRMNDASISHGSFGEKKYSAYKVWTIICDEVWEKYPQYANIAQARFCIESTILLRDAALSRYRKDDKIVNLQNVVKKYWHCLSEIRITTLKMKVFSYIVARCYNFASFI